MKYFVAVVGMVAMMAAGTSAVETMEVDGVATVEAVQ